jgi:ferrous iron transport protein A
MHLRPRHLAELAPGESARIAQVTGPADLRHRLLEMGLTRGTIVRLVRIALLGDPVELHVRGYRLSVRKSEVASVNVEAA